MASAWDDEAPAVGGSNHIAVPVLDDDDSNVKDNWDDEEVPVVTTVPVSKPKQLKKDKKQEGSKDVPLTDEERQKQKIENEKRIRIEDLELVKTFIGGAQRNITLEPTTMEEFDDLAAGLADSLTALSTSENYPGFVEKLVRDLAVSLSHDVLSRLSISFSALSQEKQRLVQQHKKTKKKKATVKLTVESEIQDADGAANIFGGDEDFEDEVNNVGEDFDFM